MSKRQLRIGLIGYQFMGKAHSNAYRQVARFFDESPVEPVMQVLCGRNEAKVTNAARKFGWAEVETDFRKLIARPDIEVIDIAAPGNMHEEIGVAAALAGKMVLCEKPLGNTLGQAKRMYNASIEGKAITAICHNYRFAPAIQLAKKLISEGQLGEIYHFRGVYLQDWIVDPKFPLVWRLQKDIAGSGSHGDLNAHVIDMARYLVGEIAEVTGLLKTFIKERPLLAEVNDRLGGAASDEMGEVDVDDVSMFMARFENGAVGTFEATRFATGHKNYNRFEINGSKGSVIFNLERMNELEVYINSDAPEIKGFRNVQVTDGCHPYTANWWPAGHIIGYEHTFIHLVYEMLQAFNRGESLNPDWLEGLKNQAVLEAVVISADSGRWVSPSSLL